MSNLVKNPCPPAGRKKLKVFVAMSGGVDSSVAAALLKYGYIDSCGRFRVARGRGPEARSSYAVIGAHMKCYNLDGCGERDAEDARRAAEVLGIPFYIFDFEKEYKNKVVEYMVDGYKKGITPNPDVMCNKEIKFGLFLKKALELGADYVATGHYVKLGVRGQGLGVRKKIKNTLYPILYTLYAARDKNKDQSYFLWTLTQKQLKHCLFPLGDITKPEVRKLAQKFNLPNADKKDSQGICFLGRVDLKDFLKKYIPEKKGLILDASGKVVGEHKGAWFYTIGQRSGIGLGGGKKPRYIAEKDVKENALLVAEENDPALYRKEIELKNLNFINPDLSSLIRANSRINVLARVRYRQPLFKARLCQMSNVKCWLVFDRPQKFVASGQSAVFYSAKRGDLPAGRQVLGGGIIV